ncbi:TatD family hydrolase [Thalassotalea sp. PS06]|uniref:TatD family hydrolase n=1 Tax=Thalassotalea sp. PS06 TaxID=2594005 RepID=UPI00163DB5C4|nr:TatD family hydrolase [Thalassotalea sp. PS06]
MKFTDSHCHFDFPEFDDNRETIAEALIVSGVHRLIVPGVSAEHWSRQLNTCSNLSSCYFAFGIHPWWIENAKEADLDKLEQNLKNSEKVVALGEIGLDAKVANFDKQQRFFEQQLALAKQLQLPVLVHHRQTHSPISKALRHYQLSRGGIIHAFSGSYQQAKLYIDLGYRLGIGGVITYDRAKKTRETVSRVPLDALVLETDAPAMPLSGRQGEANSPLYLTEVFKTFCDLRNEKEQLIAEQLEKNNESLFSF